MNVNNQKGYFEVIGILVIMALFVAMFFVSFKGSEERVSGIVYNTKNDHALSGNTTFSVRASVDTYVSQSNESSYCLPLHSPYIALVNKAAEDKNIKVIVTASKYFAIQAPWTCKGNVKVTEVR